MSVKLKPPERTASRVWAIQAAGALNEVLVGVHQFALSLWLLDKGPEYFLLFVLFATTLPGILFVFYASWVDAWGGALLLRFSSLSVGLLAAC